jgi:DNA-binding PadR family transcriptional regulator
MWNDRWTQWGRDFERDWRRLSHDWNQGWGRRGRVFGRGDLKYVILSLLKEQPRHGYDIIRELESRFSGMYAPSPGTVYPTLQLLEDMGAVTSQEQEGRKVYTITDEGRRILEEHGDLLDGIAGRLRDWMRGEGSAELRDVMREMAGLIEMTAREARHVWNDPVKLRRIRDLVARTREELRSILREESTTL